MESVNRICRTCLAETENMKIIFEVTISEEQNIRITDFIRRLTSLKITKCDDLPDNICTLCIEELCKAFNFAQMCIVTDTKLKLNRKSISYDDDDDDEFQQTCNLEDIKENHEDDDDYAVTPINGAESGEEKLFILNGHLKEEEENHTSDDPALTDIEIKTQPLAETSSAQDHQEFKKCKVCFESFADDETLGRHELLHESYKCEVCGKTFPKSNQLKVHSRSHVRREDKQFCCSECGQKFSYFYLLEKHSYKHRKQKPFPCMKCNKGCITAENLKRHMRIHDENYVKRSHTCNICSKEFPYPSFLAEHMKNHTGEKPYLCSICGKGFRQSGTLHYHIRSHTGKRPYTCEVCNDCFTSPGVLRVHMRRHTNERPYVCDICGVAFRQSTDMKSHRRIHTGDKPVLCTICGKRLSSTGQLTVHIRSHTGEKPYPCQVCQKAFATRTMLVKHERIHTGERPYICKICGKAFNQSSTLKTHTNVHKLGRKSEAQNVSCCVVEENYANTKPNAVLPTAVSIV